MSDCARTIRQSLETLLNETFGGVPENQSTFFADSGPEGCLLGVLSALPAERARRTPAPGRRSIAQHARHVRFHLEVIERLFRGVTGENNWDESWSVDASSDTAWKREVEALRSAFLVVRSALAELDWQPLTLSAAIGAIAHGAYHLGAIRQMLRAASS